MRRLAVIGFTAVVLAWSMTPGFGQGLGSGAEPRNERFSSAGQAILAAQGAGAGLAGAGASPSGSSGSQGALGTGLSGSSNYDEEITVGANVRVNAPQQPSPNGLLGRSETTIAATADGRRLVAGWNDAQGFCGPPFGSACTPQSPSGLSGFGFSTDGGATWTDGGAPDPALGPNVFTRGDPWLAVSKNNTFFYANLAAHAVTGASLGLSVHRGRFRGSTFAWQNVRVFDSPDNASDPGSDFLDKEAIATDPQDEDNAVVSVTNFQELCGVPQFGFGQIEVWRTRNGGNTWQGPAIAGPEAADSVATCGNAGTLQQSSVPAFGPDGRVYVTWQFGPTFNAAGVASTDADIVVARSDNGGRTFRAPVKVADINSMRAASPVGYNRGRINDHPRIAVITGDGDDDDDERGGGDDGRGGRNDERRGRDDGRRGRDDGRRGRVIVVFPSAVIPTTAPQTAQNPTSVQVFASYSDNRGNTWSAPTPLGGAVPATGVKRFWPSVTVGHDGKSVDVIYYESLEQARTPACDVAIGGGLRRTGPLHSIVSTKLVHSQDGGKTFGPPVTVSSAPSDWCTALSNIRPNFGDYIGSAAAHRRGANLVLATWADAGELVLVSGQMRNVPATFFSRIVIRESRSSERD